MNEAFALKEFDISRDVLDGINLMTGSRPTEEYREIHIRFAETKREILQIINSSSILSSIDDLTSSTIVEHDAVDLGNGKTIKKMEAAGGKKVKTLSGYDGEVRAWQDYSKFEKDSKSLPFEAIRDDDSYNLFIGIKIAR